MACLFFIVFSLLRLVILDSLNIVHIHTMVKVVCTVPCSILPLSDQLFHGLNIHTILYLLWMRLSTIVFNVFVFLLMDFCTSVYLRLFS